MALGNQLHVVMLLLVSDSRSNPRNIPLHKLLVRRWLMSVVQNPYAHTCPHFFSAQKWCSPGERFLFLPFAEFALGNGGASMGSYASSSLHAGHTTILSSVEDVSRVKPSRVEGVGSIGASGLGSLVLKLGGNPMGLTSKPRVMELVSRRSVIRRTPRAILE